MRANSLSFPRVLVFAPSRGRASETFIRANLRGLADHAVAYCGDERPWRGERLRLLYGLVVLLSKVFSRLGCHRLATAVVTPVAVAICRREAPDVVLVEFGFHAIRVMEVVSRTGLPLVVQFHGSDASCRRYYTLLRHRYRRLLSLAAAIVVKSRPMRERLLALGGPDAPLPRVLVSPCGADQVLFGVASPGTAPPHFLSVGRFVEKKGPLHTLEAFVLAARSRPAMRLMMVGDGPLVESCRARAAAMGIAQRVDIVGWKPQAWIAAHMLTMRGFLQHSLTAPDGDQEGSPVAVMEAQLSGLPVVATRHAGIPEVVEDGVTGHLVEEGDVEAMAAMIGRLADEPYHAARLGEAGRKRVLSRFTLDHHLRDLRTLLECVATEGRG